VPPEVTPLLKTAFEMDEDEDPVVETIGAGDRYAMLDLARIIPAAPPPLAQVRGRVLADLNARRAADRARQVAATIVARINAGTPAATAFSGAGMPLPPVEPVNARRLEISQGGQQVPPPLAMMFSMKAGTAKLLAAPNNAGWFVVNVATTEAGDAATNPALVQATRAQFGEIAGQEYAEQFTRAVQKQIEVERDADAIAALKTQLLGPGSR